MQNDVLATGIMSFVMHELVYFGRSLPWIIIDAIPYFNKYKIQNVGSRSYFPNQSSDLNMAYHLVRDAAKGADLPRTVEMREIGAFESLYR
jgi:hypothetical protein